MWWVGVAKGAIIQIIIPCRQLEKEEKVKVPIRRATAVATTAATASFTFSTL